jgi:ATP/ADP translocase
VTNLPIKLSHPPTLFDLAISLQSLFYATLAPFLFFFPFFSFLLYPFRAIIHPLDLIPLPTGGLSYPVNILRHWSFAFYYIMAELWGSAGVPLLFWSFANQIVGFNQVSCDLSICPSLQAHSSRRSLCH